MKLSEIKGEKALDVLADLIDPVCEIASDKEVAGFIRQGKKSKAIKAALKKHKKEVITILAVLDGVPVEKYECNVLSLPKKVLDIINDAAVFELFTSQGQETQTPSGSVTENITVSEN